MVNFSRSFARLDNEEQGIARLVSPVSSPRAPASTSPQLASTSFSSSPSLLRDSPLLEGGTYPSGHYTDTIALNDYLNNSTDVSNLNILNASPESVRPRTVIRRVPVGSKAGVTRQTSNDDMSPSNRDIQPSSPDTLIGSPPGSARSGRWTGLSSFKNTLGKYHRRRFSGFEALGSGVASISEGHVRYDEEIDEESFHKKFGDPPSFCWSKEDVQQKRKGCFSMTIMGLSIYSTIMSGIWLVVSLVQPRWGHKISSGGGLQPSTATVLATFVAKTIEMSFVTVVVSFLGQVVSRRAFARKSRGMTLAEVTMRNWVIQPGSMFTHFETLRYAALSVLGILALLSSFTAITYTTASDALVSPKLKYGRWEQKVLSGYVRSSYGNSGYLQATCPGMLDETDPVHSPLSCMDVQLSGESYRNLMGYMRTWTDINQNGTSLIDELERRPAGTAMLNGSTTLFGSWIETQHSKVSKSFEATGRLINNVTLAMPHPGVASAATLPLNGILQPDDLSGVGEYAVRAGVVSPAVNAMCVNLTPNELSPLIYTEWPNSVNNVTGVGEQMIGWDGWENDIPKPLRENGEEEFLNRTDVDAIFRWGREYGRRPPVFRLYPADDNFIINATAYMSDALYLLGKSTAMQNYTLCELRSWLSPNCSTQFNVSLTTGSRLSSHCEDPTDEHSYLKSFDENQDWSRPSTDWRWIANQWQIAANLDGGIQNNNASNARILMQLALTSPHLPSYLPSLAEALAVFASSTVVSSAKDTPFRHYWEYKKPGNILGEPGVLQQFNASVVTQEYTSGHVNDWQGAFYVVLILAFLINLLCGFYFIISGGLVTDYTESQNLCALAMNSPPTEQLKGSCGGGPRGRDLVVPWRIAYAPSANHYFLEEANQTPWRGRYSREQTIAVQDYGNVPALSSTYKRLSSLKGWL